MPETLQVRVEGAASLPTLIYLPGLHGDWTLIIRLSQCLRGRVRFVSFTYPRTLCWNLEDYAVAIEKALAGAGYPAGLGARGILRFSNHVDFAGAGAISGFGGDSGGRICEASGAVDHAARQIPLLVALAAMVYSGLPGLP